MFSVVFFALRDVLSLSFIASDLARIQHVKASHESAPFHLSLLPGIHHASKAKRFEVVEHIDNPKVISAYLNSALQDDDPHQFMLALGEVVKAAGVAKVAADAGLGPTCVYKISPLAFPLGLIQSCGLPEHAV